MKKLGLLTVLAACSLRAGPQPALFDRVRETIVHYLGLPYVWGSSGIKSFDCSGFVWRVYTENGLYFKRTTARKLYLSLPPATDTQKKEFGTLIFFDNLKHVGIVNDESTFYHAQTSKGTNLSPLNPYWNKLVCGHRRMAN